MKPQPAGVQRRWMQFYIAAGLCVSAVYFVLEGATQAVTYDLVGIIAVAGLIVGIRRNRPATPRAWWFVAAGLGLTVAGDIAWTIYEQILNQEAPFPSTADALYLTGYPVIAVGLIWLCWVRRPSRSDLIDAAIVGIGYGVVAWTLFVGPYLADGAYPWLERVVSAAYPTMDIPLVAAAALLMLTPGIRSRSFVYLAIAVVVSVAADAVYAQEIITDTYSSGGWLDAGWLISYVAWGAAALDPSAKVLARPERSADSRLTIPRLVFLGAGLLTGQFVWYFHHAPHDFLDLAVVTTANGLLVLLVCLRLWDTFGALDRNERRFRTLVEHSSDIISVYDADGTLRYASPALSKVLGEDPADWTGHDVMALVHPDDANRLALVFARLKQKPDEKRAVELRLRHKDGGWRNVEVIGTNRLDDPAVRGIVGNARDVTARTAVEEALRRAQALNNSVIDSGSDGIFAFDRDCVISVWNPMMERTTGMGRSQVMGRCAFEIFPFLEETGEARLLHAALRGESAIAPAQPNQLPDSGVDGFYEAYYSPLRDPAGDIIGGLCLVRNVTDRTYAERALASHNRILALAAGGAPLDDVLTETCLELESSINGSRCSVMLVDLATHRLMPAAGPNLPLAYERALTERGGIMPGPAVGSCGTAAFRGEPVICVDTLTDPLWADYLDLAVAFDLRACWSVPIPDGESGDVLGTFVVYHTAPRGPSKHELALVSEAGHLVGIAIRAQRAQGAVRFQADLLDQVTAAVIATDARGVVTHWNRHASVLYGWQQDEAIGRDMFGLTFGTDDPAFATAIVQRTAAGEPWGGEITARRKDGSIVPVQLNLAPLTGDRGEPVGRVGVAVDLSERKAFEARLAHQAFHDALTGLPNRALFADRLTHALTISVHRVDPVGVLMLDLDRFKVINDGLGHAAGDRLLIAVGRRIEESLRETDTLARLGGDEFAVLLEGMTLVEASEIAERILAAFREPLIIDGREVYAATSIGIAVSTPDRIQADEVLRAADIALYRAKRAGRGKLVVFDPTETDPDADWLVLEAELRRALTNGELLLHYQPVVNLDHYGVVTVEALVRWQHPTRGLLPPMEFIPLAEETGLITAITGWALDESCQQLACWQKELGERAPGHVNVNLTTRDLRDPDFVDRVDRALAAAGISARSLRLEITEQVLVEELRAAASTLRALSARGVRLEIDDFGAGASSLASLRAVEAEVLKLDRAFVRGMTDGGEDRVVVGAITAMAHALGLAVTAEGIETAEQLAAAQAAGCDHGQGFFFARPMPAADLTRWMAGEGLRTEHLVPNPARLVAGAR